MEVKRNRENFCSFIDKQNIKWKTFREYRDIITHGQLETQEKEIIKTSKARTVSFVNLAQKAFLLKEFKSPLFFDKLRFFFQKKAFIEWNNLNILWHKNFYVAKPIAVGQKGFKSYILIEKLENTETLKNIDFKKISVQKRRCLIRNLARLLAKLHNNKFIHKDLHFDNFLITEDNTVYMIDVHSFKLCHFIGKEKCMQNLSMLGGSAYFHVNYTDYICFLREYVRECKYFDSLDERKIFYEIKARVYNYMIHFWNRRSKRCIHSNKYFEKIAVGSFVGYKDRKEDIERDILHLDSIIARSEIIKDSRSSLVLRTPCGILKQFRRKKKRNFLIDCFRHSRAKRAWISAYQCEIRGIPTAKPLLFYDVKWLFFPKTSFLLTKELENCQTLHDYVDIFPKAPKGTVFLEKIELLQKLGRLLRAMHTRGISHRDLKGTNILIAHKSFLYLIDLDGFKTRTSIGIQRRLKDFRRLVRALKLLKTITKTDILRLLKSYLPFSSHEEYSYWIKRI